jgi:hypothetical protein
MILRRLMRWLVGLAYRSTAEAQPDPFAALLKEFSAESDRLVEAEIRGAMTNHV